MILGLVVAPQFAINVTSILMCILRSVYVGKSTTGVNYAGGLIVGNLEIYRPGEYAICDKCDKPKPLLDSYSVMVDGQAVIWLCGECK